MHEKQLKAGIYAGLIGGLAFGLMTGMMGMLEMVARVVRSDSALVGFIYHIFNSAVVGALFVPSSVASHPTRREDLPSGWCTA